MRMLALGFQETHPPMSRCEKIVMANSRTASSPQQQPKQRSRTAATPQQQYTTPNMFALAARRAASPALKSGKSSVAYLLNLYCSRVESMPQGTLANPTYYCGCSVRLWSKWVGCYVTKSNSLQKLICFCSVNSGSQVDFFDRFAIG